MLSSRSIAVFAVALIATAGGAFRGATVRCR